MSARFSVYVCRPDRRFVLGAHDIVTARAHANTLVENSGQDHAEVWDAWWPKDHEDPDNSGGPVFDVQKTPTRRIERHEYTDGGWEKVNK